MARPVHKPPSISLSQQALRAAGAAALLGHCGDGAALPARGVTVPDVPLRIASNKRTNLSCDFVCERQRVNDRTSLPGQGGWGVHVQPDVCETDTVIPVCGAQSSTCPATPLSSDSRSDSTGASSGLTSQRKRPMGLGLQGSPELSLLGLQPNSPRVIKAVLVHPGPKHLRGGGCTALPCYPFP